MHVYSWTNFSVCLAFRNLNTSVLTDFILKMQYEIRMKGQFLIVQASVLFATWHRYGLFI
jgi:hypothetical protein